jgi:hypothetical protein
MLGDIPPGIFLDGERSPRKVGLFFLSRSFIEQATDNASTQETTYNLLESYCPIVKQPFFSLLF